jgi:DNA-directed RNA polymerase subunit RPC12/RpoP
MVRAVRQLAARSSVGYLCMACQRPCGDQETLARHEPVCPTRVTCPTCGQPPRVECFPDRPANHRSRVEAAARLARQRAALPATF